MDQPQPSPCARLRALRAIRSRLRSPRHDPHHAQTLDQVSSLFLNLNFLDRLLEVAQGSYEVTSTMIKRAEINFSRIRRDALEQEWQSAFPSIKKIIDFVGLRQKSIITFEELCSLKEADDVALAIYSEKKIAFDPLYEVASTYYEKDTRSAEDLIKAIIGVLYRVGAIGVKLKNGNRFMYSHLDEALLPIAQFTEDARIRIHPMLWGAFRLAPQ